MTTSIPRILLTPDFETRALKRGPTAFYDLDARYADAVSDAGGLPIVAPYLEDDAHISALLDGVDGVVLTGGDFDVDPALFGAEPHPKLGTVKKNRTVFERRIHDDAARRGLPILGICGGMQLMNVLRNGTLYQDIDSEFSTTVNHQQAGPKTAPVHGIAIKKGSVFAALVGGVASIDVNSTHHQAVKNLGDGLVASGISTDGLIEVIEDPRGAFYVGVQWHPEAMPRDEQRAIYRALVDAARVTMSRR